MLFITSMRRKRLKAAPFPPDWERILERDVPLYGRVPESDREELRSHIKVFLAEKVFEGGGGFTITDRVRLVIAMPACLLLLHRDTDYYPGLSSIVVYEGEYLAPLSEMDEAGIVTEGIDRRSGEYSRDGAVVLSWEDVVAEGIDVHESYNVVLHEFAHQLDAEDGVTSGEPFLSRRAPRSLAESLEREYLLHRRHVRRGRPTTVDPYGAESLAEFFAVATESFFENGFSLRLNHPHLYSELMRYYRQDPAEWPDSPAAI